METCKEKIYSPPLAPVIPLPWTPTTPRLLVAIGASVDGAGTARADAVAVGVDAADVPLAEYPDKASRILEFMRDRFRIYSAE